MLYATATVVLLLVAVSLVQARPAAAALAPPAAASTDEITIHVCAERGDDTNSGGPDAPLRTLIAARNAARRLRGTQAVAQADSGRAARTATVVLGATRAHRLQEPLVLDERDSHTTWKAATGEHGSVLVSGGIHVDPAAVSARPGHSGQYQVNMTALGLADLGTVLPAKAAAAPAGHPKLAGSPPLHPQLFINQHAGWLARWPNAKNQTSWQWAYTNDCLSSSCSSGCNCSAPDITGFTWRKTETNGSGVPPAVDHRWADEADAYLHGYWLFDWRDGYVPLKAILPEVNGFVVGTEEESGTSLAKVKTGARYYAFNILDELDSGSEYYLSRSGATKGMLYFQPPAGAWPPAAGSGALAGAYVSAASNLVVLGNGTSHVSFEGISWQHARSTAIVSADTVTHITIDGCTVANSGGGGIELVGFHNVVKGSQVYNVGGTGISVKGGLHRSLTRGDNLVTHNEIHHYAQWLRTYQPAILWAGVGNSYTLNHIHDAPHTAILGGGNEAECAAGQENTIEEKMCGGNDCVFESNTIEHTNYECDDSGSFYTCGQGGTAFVNRGNILRNTTFRRVRQEDTTFLGYPSVQAIYLDDQMSGWLIEDNTVIDAQMGLMVGGGRDTIVRGNSFINCDTGLHIDNRGTGGERSTCLGPDLTSLKAAMKATAWQKYGLTDMMAPNASAVCSPVNASATGNCFEGNKQDWEVWCGADPDCMNNPGWLSHEGGNKKGGCGGNRGP
jgi:hypothetical protein